MENIAIRVYGPENYKTNDWSGGRTTQTAIYPETASYVERDFLWRLSSATVEVEESDFTRLPDYDRIIMVLSGEVVLFYEGERVARLAELEQDRFDGALKTKSFGKITDYNLMYRKGTMGYMETVRATREKQIMRPELSKTTQTAESAQHDCMSEGYYCKEGYAVISCGAESRMIKAGEQLVIDSALEGRPEVSVAGEGVLVRTQVFFTKSEFLAEEIPAETASFADFVSAMKIHLTGFRGSKYIFKSLQRVWYDRELQAGIRKIEGFYLPPAVTLLGILAISFACAPQFPQHQGAILLGMLGWILLNMLVIWPFVYMLVLPKPIAKHIKRIDGLTPYERRLYEEDCGRNERLESIMDKYKTQDEFAAGMRKKKR